MSEHQSIKGWCPDAFRPMKSGDGWILRIKPCAKALNFQQIRAIANVARTHGNGYIDLTQRANLQIRGLTNLTLEVARDTLQEAGLVHSSPILEARKNIIINPLAKENHALWHLAQMLENALLDFPDLPSKFGYTVDDHAQPLLRNCASDIALESDGANVFIRAKGAQKGIYVPSAHALTTVKQLIEWFLQTGGVQNGRGRFADLMQKHALPFKFAPNAPRTQDLPAPKFGTIDNGRIHLGAAFGLVHSDMLDQLTDSIRGPIRLSPWRSLIVETPRHGELIDKLQDSWISANDDARLRIVSCTGAPHCTLALQSTRPLAQKLARHLPPFKTLHITGCEKSCAQKSASDIVLLGQSIGYDLIKQGTTHDPAFKTALSPEQIIQYLGQTMQHTYETNGAAIYKESFATIRREANLSRFTPAQEPVVVRMIHATGMVGLEEHIQFSPDMAQIARDALKQGAPILCDVKMVSEGITRSRLPANNQVICTLNEPCVPEQAKAMGNTRSAAAVELWRPHLAGAIVAIGNAPTALFHLLNLLKDPDFPRPGAIIGCPVGFIGAQESKEALMADLPVPSMIVQGRLGGSALTVAAINALACEKE